MTIARKDLIPQNQEVTVHCVSRCVRRAFLCGKDAYSGKDYAHRKKWIVDRLKFLSEQFAIEMLGFSVMQNHIHIVCRTLPQRASAWTPDQVIRRWKAIWPGKREPSGEGAQLQPEVIAALAADKKRVRKTRKRLATLGEFMRALKEPLAREANREDGVSGCFWEGRYKAQPLLDHSAVLAAMTYVDLNPIRAAIAATPEASSHTSACTRIRARQAAARLKAMDASTESSSEGGTTLTSHQQKMRAIETEAARAADWLAPLERAPESSAMPGNRNAAIPATDLPQILPALPLSLDEYLEVLDWTGREIREGKRGHIPEHIAPILKRLEIDCDCWLQTVLNFGSLFYRVVGKIEALQKAAKRLGRRWLKGKNAFVSKAG